jgi:cell division protein FtsA
MSKDNIIVGIDVGSSNIRAVIAQDLPDLEFPRVIGVGVVPSFGIRRGVIVDPEEVNKVIDEAVEKSERMAGTTVRNANVSIGGIEIGFQNSKGVIAVGRADGEVIEDDLVRALKEAQVVSLPLNKEIIHVVPKNYRLDDQENIKNPLGMKGVRMEVNALIIEGSSSHVKNIGKCINHSGIEINSLILEPLAAAKSVLNKKQKELGVVLVNMGGGTTSLAVFEEGDLLHTAVLPVGSGHVTNDIAIGLRTTVDVAEKIKLEYGCAISKEVNKKEEIDLSQVDSHESGFVSLHHVAEIMEARLEEIFNLVNKELKLIGKSGLLPAGIVLTGGGAKVPQISELAKSIIGLPAQVGFPINLGGMMDKVDDPSFATVIGLILWEKEARQNSGSISQTVSKTTGDTVKRIKKWIEKFLP